MYGGTEIMGKQNFATIYDQSELRGTLYINSWPEHNCSKGSKKCLACLELIKNSGQGLAVPAKSGHGIIITEYS